MTNPLAAVPGVWAISDGAAGNERQALALAEAMGLIACVQRVRPHAPWRWFAPRLTAAAQRAFAAEIAAPWPAIAIGCGRHAALLTRALRQWSGGATFTVQILDPRIEPANFDLVIAPQHDRLRGANVLATLGSLHVIDDAWLQRAKMEFSTLQQLPVPRTALLVGGPRRGMGMNEIWLDRFIARLETLLAGEGGSLMIALSRRTPDAWRRRLRGAFSSGCVHFWSSPADGINPYAGYLAYAERIVVTPDSVNMLSEACATGAPVLTMLPQLAHGRLAEFHAALRAQGRLRELGDAAISTMQQLPPLRESAAIAAQVWQRYRARGSSTVAEPAGA